MTWPTERITSRTKPTNISARYKIHKKMENGGKKKKEKEKSINN